MKYVIRADGSKAVGMGHLNRAIIIINYLRIYKNAKVKLIVKYNVSAKRFLESRDDLDCDDHVIWLDEDSRKEDEYALFGCLIKDGKSHIIIDLIEYQRPIKYLEIARKYFEIISVISDTEYIETLPVDNYINGNPVIQADEIKSVTRRKSMCRYLLGPKYFIMGHEHFEVVHEAAKRNGVLLTVGGSDHNNILFVILESFASMNFDNEMTIYIVSSEATGYSSKLREYVEKSCLKIILFFDIPTLANVWGAVDVAITAGGNTLFERVASGLPGATVTQLPRQSKIANAFQDYGVNYHIGYGPALSAGELQNELINFIKNDVNHIKQKKMAKDMYKHPPLPIIFSEITDN
jgi:spore coat polysaccharide biosynthesis predicted glycosyltransferase SpsG